MLFRKPLKYYAENFFAIDGYWRRNCEQKGKHVIDVVVIKRAYLTKNYIIPLFGDISVNKISSNIISEKLCGLNCLCGTTKNAIIICLDDIYANLIEKNIVKENPTKNVIRFSRAIVNGRGALSLEELAKLFPQNHDELIKIWHSQMYATAFLILRDTGLRPGELRALQWKDWYPEKKFIPITKAIEAGTRSKIKGTKTGAFKPAIVSDFTATEISNLKRIAKHISSDDFIFASRYGIPPRGNTMSTCFRQGVRRADLNRPEISPYWLRHTFNTLALLYLDEADVRKLMGHTTSKMTRHYRHPDIFLLQKEAEKIYPKIQKLHDAMNITTNF
jgi:integrase